MTSRKGSCSVTSIASLILSLVVTCRAKPCDFKQCEISVKKTAAVQVVSRRRVSVLNSAEEGLGSRV
eukprot:564393-Rhodomonas_salina.1